MTSTIKNIIISICKQFQIMSCISCLVSLLLTFVIPLKLTYSSLSAKTDSKIWAIYWAFYTLVHGIFWLIPFLE